MSDGELNHGARGTAAARPAVLLVDDDPLIVESLQFILEDEFDVLSAGTRRAAKSVLAQAGNVPSLALVDLGLPPTPHAPDEGFTLINELLGLNPYVKILVLSGQSQRANIQHALTLGAVDFVPKPCDALLIKARLKHQLMILDAEQPARAVPSAPDRLIGASAAVETLRVLIRQFADTPFPVLIEGESGSGKELVAQALHGASCRAILPFLTLNCAAFTAELLEAQLFGHAKGAYTGADSARPGFFDEAGRGSLFLDEVGELPPELQAKLLRVLENGEYYRLGETQPRRVQARVIAATNRDLREEVRAGAFRADLFHRLSVLTIQVPPLRERGEDCLLLLDGFLKLYAQTVKPFTLDSAARACLQRYAFPGNVRELRNIVIRLGAKYPGRSVGLTELEQELESSPVLPANAAQLVVDDVVEQQLRRPGFRLDDTLSDWERRYIGAALKMSNGNLSQAARLLGINRTTLYSKVQRLSTGTL